MKKILILVAALALAFTVTATAQTNAAPVAQLTPADVTSINNLLPLLPASCQPFVIKLLALIAALGVVGRVVVGWRNGGLGGVIAGLLGGTNGPKPADASQLSQGAAASKNRLPLLLLAALLLPCALLTGCGSIPHQLIDNESGTGLKMKIPVGYSGNNVFEMDITLGTFKHTSVIQPVETNRVYTPDMVVAAATRGTLAGGQALGSGGGTNLISGNPMASVKGGDSYVVTTGHAVAGITNNADVGTESWQDAPPSQSK